MTTQTQPVAFTPVLIYRDTEAQHAYSIHIAAIIDAGNCLFSLWPLHYKRETSFNELVSLLQSKELKRDLQLKYIEAHDFKVEGMKVKPEKLIEMADILDLTFIIECFLAIKTHLAALQKIRPGKLRLQHLLDGQGFAVSEELSEKVKSWFEVYTQSQAQNEVLQASEKLKECFELLAKNGVSLPSFARLPQVLKSLLDASEQTDLSKLRHNPFVFETGHFSHLQK